MFGAFFDCCQPASLPACICVCFVLLICKRIQGKRTYRQEREARPKLTKLDRALFRGTPLTPTTATSSSYLSISRSWPPTKRNGGTNMKINYQMTLCFLMARWQLKDIRQAIKWLTGCGCTQATPLRKKAFTYRHIRAKGERVSWLECVGFQMELHLAEELAIIDIGSH